VGIIPAGQRDVVYYLDPMAASADLQIFSRDGRHLAGTGMSARPQSLQTVRIDTSAGTEATITTDYVPGQAGQNYIEFEARGEAGETLGFDTTGSISSGAGVLSLSGGVLYRGNGVRAERLGAVDTVYNGQGGKPLRINFVSAFENSSFDNGVAGSSSIPGWTVINQRVKLDGTDQVAGWPTPVNTTLPMGITTAGTPIQSPGEATSVGGSFTTTLNDAVISTASGLSVKLSSALTVSASGLAHGPAIVSANAIALREGDQVAIDWKATGTRDNFDVYGYLLNVDNGNTRTILDASGETADWTTARTTVPVDGQYKFVFISGSHDYTGATASGSDFYIDNLRVTTTPPTLSSADVATLRGLVSYSNLYTA
ncbi:MAG: hypothetical protein EBS89_14295, partial [Proteobacteria bacterium]|nr:hypothetical protein [Pseudomonadota bacterium]